MEQRQIIEGNKLIAEFMDYQWPSTDRYSDIEAKELKQYEINKLAYHSSWERLMPVVEKIDKYHSSNYYDFDKTSTEDYCCGSSIDEDGCIITVHFKQLDATKQRKVKQFISPISTSKIESVWLAVVEFIKWYNQTPQKNLAANEATKN